MIAQAKRSAQQQQGRPGRRQKPGQPKPGDQQPGDQPGTQANAQGAPPMKTRDPKNAAALVGDKNTWGNLPGYIRDEMENVIAVGPQRRFQDEI